MCDGKVLRRLFGAVREGTDKQVTEALDTQDLVTLEKDLSARRRRRVWQSVEESGAL